MPLHAIFQPPPEVRSTQSTPRRTTLLRPNAARRQGIKEAKRAVEDDLDESLSMLSASVSRRYGWQSREAYMEAVHSMPRAAAGSAHPVDRDA